jgi:uncharacterized Fe-S cluster-containing protein
MITQNLLKELFDYEDGKLIRKVSRSRTAKAGDIAGSLDKTSGYYRIGIKGKWHLLHRIIFMYHNGSMPEFVDHINGIPTDNRIENLRVATKIENSRNRAKHSNNTSGRKNVSWHKQHNKWSVTISAEGKKKHIGYFEDFELADLVAMEARDKYHGQFARNF